MRGQASGSRGMKLGIFGTGYVGLVTATCFAELGHSVIAVDKDERVIASRAAGVPTFYEPGLEQMLVTALVGRAVPVAHLPLPHDDPRWRCPEFSKARARLGWNPRVPLAEGLRRTIHAFVPLLFGDELSAVSESYRD